MDTPMSGPVVTDTTGPVTHLPARAIRALEGECPNRPPEVGVTFLAAASGVAPPITHPYSLASLAHRTHGCRVQESRDVATTHA